MSLALGIGPRDTVFIWHARRQLVATHERPRTVFQFYDDRLAAIRYPSPVKICARVEPGNNLVVKRRAVVIAIQVRRQSGWNMDAVAGAAVDEKHARHVIIDTFREVCKEIL